MVQEIAMFISVLHLERWKLFIQTKWKRNTFQAINMESFLRKKVFIQQIELFPQKNPKKLAKSFSSSNNNKFWKTREVWKDKEDKLDDPNSNRKVSLPTSQKEINPITIKIIRIIQWIWLYRKQILSNKPLAFWLYIQQSFVKHWHETDGKNNAIWIRLSLRQIPWELCTGFSGSQTHFHEVLGFLI